MLPDTVVGMGEVTKTVDSMCGGSNNSSPELNWEQTAQLYWDTLVYMWVFTMREEGGRDK